MAFNYFAFYNMTCPYPEWLLWFFIGTTIFLGIALLVTVFDGWRYVKKS